MLSVIKLRSAGRANAGGEGYLSLQKATLETGGVRRTMSSYMVCGASPGMLGILPGCSSAGTIDVMILSLLLAVVPETMSVTSPVSSAAPVLRPAGRLSAEVTAALRQFEHAVAVERSAFEAMPAGGGIAANLVVRVALEQAMRRAVDPALTGLHGADRTDASAAIWRRIAEVDAANTTYLKSVLPRDGWFRSRRDGADVARNAWLIVQHSPDQAFQRLVVARMRPLVASGDASGADYALLYDRTEMFAGRPQLYGSQMSCAEGRWTPAPTVDPAELNRRRASMGLPPMVEYLKHFDGTC